MLMRRINFVVAVLFMLNPVLMLITGLHSQVDHVAIVSRFCELAFNRPRARKFLPAFILTRFFAGNLPHDQA